MMNQSSFRAGHVTLLSYSRVMIKIGDICIKTLIVLVKHLLATS